MSPTQLSILNILVRDGIEAEIAGEAIGLANLASALVLALSGTKKGRRLAPDKIKSIVSGKLPYVSFESDSKDQSSKEILAEARKEAEILASNPTLSPLEFLTGKRG